MVRLSALTAMAWSSPWSRKPNGVLRNSVTLSQRHLLINHVPFLAPCLTDELLFVKNSLVKTEGVQEVSLQEFSSHAGTTTSSDSGTLNSHKRTPPPKKKKNAWASLVAQRLKHLPAPQETRVRSLGREDPWRRK